MAANDTTDEAPERRAAFEEWWAHLSGEERVLVMDCVRLEQADELAAVEQAHRAPTGLVSGGLPSKPLADFVRRRPEYLERFALADVTARRDDTGIGLPTVPESHERTAPILDKD